MLTLTIDEVRMLADLERRMDSGEQPYVVTDGGRKAVEQTIMDELGLVSGQTISSTMEIAVTRAQIASLRAQLAVDRLSQ